MPLRLGANGYWRAEAPATAGERYMLVIDGQAVPDPASRAQAGDVHAPSRLIDPTGYAWQAGDWAGRPWDETVLYEMHIGTFTPEGTFEGARSCLPYLRDLGITAIELLPVAQFAGERGWGYDGVLLYAPHPAYGSPDDLRRLVDEAHGLGMSVLLDVVYNHFGPEGNYLHAIAPGFFDPGRATPWGEAISYPRRPVRDFFLDNAIYWLEEFRFDGLRLDAVDQIRDPSEPELLVELAQRVRAHGFDRPIHLTTEDERNITRLHEPGAGLYDGEWNDDYHHCLHCLLTGENESYYRDFAVDPAEDLCRALAEGYAEQGQARTFRAEPRGEPSSSLDWPTFINFNQNHDQTGNRALGERLTALASDEALKVAHALLLLSPFTPMLFMGEEAGERAPFQFFTDFTGDLAQAVREGRAAEFAGFSSFSTAVPDPNAPETFLRSRLTWADDDRANGWRDLTRRLLELRAEAVTPLVRSGRNGPARVTRTGPRNLRADWPFEDGTLSITVSLGAMPEDADPIEAPAFTLFDPAHDAWSFAFGTES